VQVQAWRKRAKEIDGGKQRAFSIKLARHLYLAKVSILFFQGFVCCPIHNTVKLVKVCRYLDRYIVMYVWLRTY
jgi:hypothetical protein